MRTRIIGAVVAAAAALGVLALILLAFAYNGAIANPPDDSENSAVGLDTPAEPGPEPTLQPPSDEDLAVMDAHEAFVVECMGDAGFPEYRTITVWDPDFDPDFSWDADLTASEQQAAFVALYGDTGAGADYHWDEAGCWGYATHMMGQDNAN